MTSVRDRVRACARWVVTRSARAYLVVGWVAFVLGAHPGYLSYASTLQLGEVRRGIYSDAHPALMTFVWSALELVWAGPLPMLLVQSGLLLFGAYAIACTVLAPRVAAIVASLVLLFPPVFAPMAVIWPEPLMAGALLAAAAAALRARSLDARRRRWAWLAGATALLVLAASCRPEVALALPPIVALALPSPQRSRRIALALSAAPRWRHIALAVIASLGVALAARGANHLLADRATYAWEQRLLVVDVVGTLRRGRVTNPQRLAAVLREVPLAPGAAASATMRTPRDAYDAYPLVNGPTRLFEPITTAAAADAMTAAWRRTITGYPSAYLVHRLMLTRQILGLGQPRDAVYDSFGDPLLIGALSHRATTSDWQVGMQAIVRAVATTPLFAPWLYIVVALAALALAWRQRAVRAVVASGLLYLVAMFFAAPDVDYRNAHGLVTTATLAFAATLVARRGAWRAEGANA